MMYNQQRLIPKRTRWVSGEYAPDKDTKFMTINQSEIAFLRLSSQQLVTTSFTTIKDIVSWMGAIQAQDYPMAKWAIGTRLPGLTDQDVENAITNAEIIRTHLLRPTWHFAPAEDIYWLLDLTAPQIKASQSSRDRQLELTEEVFSKSNATIENALIGGKQLTREELSATLRQAGIPTDQNRASHLFARAEIEKIICNGPSRGSKTTYALLSERVPNTKTLPKDEALALLARRYFTSRCPATLQDFTWWSGLPARDASLALELVKSDFERMPVGRQTYWLRRDLPIPRTSHGGAYLLPTYDEYIISYSDRSASIPAHLEHHMKEISDRGVFRPILVIDGQVAGIWKRSIHGDTLRLEIQPFDHLDPALSDPIAEAGARYGHFMDNQIEITYFN